MRAVALPGTDLRPSRLGFGSAALMARLGRRESIRLLEVAHEAGITHFDTARAYG
jgi:aryl-alcohol dehydrogenase-like predicted oxidoreductase